LGQSSDMKNNKKTPNQKSFLDGKYSKNVSKNHETYLGTTIPEGYFAASKMAILEKINHENEAQKSTKKTVFWLQPRFRYAVAASLVLLFGLSVWFQNIHQPTKNNTSDFELLTFSDDVLLSAVLLEDDQMDAYSNITLMNEIVIKAELSEQKMDDILLNSLFVEDSLLNNYTEKNFIESIIL